MLYFGVGGAADGGDGAAVRPAGSLVRRAAAQDPPHVGAEPAPCDKHADQLPDSVRTGVTGDFYQRVPIARSVTHIPFGTPITPPDMAAGQWEVLMHVHRPTRALLREYTRRLKSVN